MPDDASMRMPGRLDDDRSPARGPPTGVRLRFRQLRSFGVRTTIRLAVRHWFGTPPSPSFLRVRRSLEGATVLEIGGPTALFEPGEPFPVYPIVLAIDNIDYASATLWKDGSQRPGVAPRRGPAYRRSMVLEAGDLQSVPDATYDALLASHVLEHLADPVRALIGWTRVVRPSGFLVLVVPDRRRTFDHRRPVTPLAHMVQDFEHKRPEDDTTHTEEVLGLHDLSRDPGAGSIEEFRLRTSENLVWRAMHHHVFDPSNLRELLEHVGLEVQSLDLEPPFHIIVVARRPVAVPR